MRYFTGESATKGVELVSLRRSTTSPARLVTQAALIVVALVALWTLIGRLLATDRGLDLSDEGLYLVAADPPNLQAAWAFPFGWTIRPLFWIVGYDIAAFRTLSACILVIVSGLLGWTAMRLISDPRRSVTHHLLTSIGAAIGGVGSLLYYASMLRTPGYTWINIVAISVSLSAAFAALRRAAYPKANDWSLTFGRRSVTLFGVLAAVASLALFFSVPAKPSTLPFMLVLTTAVVAVGATGRLAMRWLVINLALLPVWITLAILSGVWPPGFVSVFRLANDMPYPFALQTVGPAIQALLLTPRALLGGFASLGDRPAELLLVSLAVLLIPLVVGRTWLGLRLVGFGLAVLCALAVAGVPFPGLRPEGVPFGGANAALSTASVIVLGAATLAGLRLKRDPISESARERLTRTLIVAVVALSPLITSFGSSFEPYPQAAVACGLVFTAAGLSVARIGPDRSRTVLAIAVLTATAIFAAAAISSGWRYPLRQFPADFRTPPLIEQTDPTSIGSHGAVLRLDPALANELTLLRARATAAGWLDGTPLVDLSYLSSPGAGYVLGAQAPHSLMLTIILVGFGGNYREITAFHLLEPYRNFPFGDSWILTTRPEVLDPAIQQEVDYTMDQVSRISGRPFPEGYRCVAAGDLVLWRPAEDSAGVEGGDCSD